MSRCRVMAVRGNGEVLGYLSPLQPSGCNHFVTSPDAALVLIIPKVWDKNQTLARIQIAAHNEAYPFLGLEKQNDYAWILRACAAGPDSALIKGRTPADIINVNLHASSKIWTVKILGGSTEELCAEWVVDTIVSLKALANPRLPVSTRWRDPKHIGDPQRGADR
ncbi:hypothetical protein FRB95_013422 [Tulasnella sp. JGI-2019a]|nr:hypothetical protein FRB95_013422 [Tulasnella sp. JGI-2019a]